MDTASRPSLYEFAGGAPAVLALAHAHHARCVADPELNHPFTHPGMNPRHVERLAAYWAEAWGGPAGYSRACGDHSQMLHLHSGNGGLGDLPDRFLDCFLLACDDAGLPAEPRFRDVLRDYMRWSLDEVVAHDDPASVGVARPVPRWSWDGLVDGQASSSGGDPSGVEPSGGESSGGESSGGESSSMRS